MFFNFPFGPGHGAGPGPNIFFETGGNFGEDEFPFTNTNDIDKDKVFVEDVKKDVSAMV